MAYIKFSQFKKMLRLLPEDNLVGYSNDENIKVSYKDFISQLELDTNVAGGLPIYFEGTVLPSTNNTGGALEKGNWTFAGPGSYTQSGGPDVVVPSGHMGILNWDGSEWYLGSSVEMPDNSAKIAEWIAGSYDKDEVVTVEGVIYRALEATTEGPPSGDWEVVGGRSDSFDLDIEGGVASYDSVNYPSKINLSPCSIKSFIVDCIKGESINTTTGAVTNAGNASRLGKVLVNEGDEIKVKITTGQNNYSIYLYSLDFTFEGAILSAPSGSEASVIVPKNGYIDAYTSTSDPDSYVEYASYRNEKGALKNKINSTYLSLVDRGLNPANGNLATKNGFKTSELICIKAGDRIIGKVNSSDSNKLFLYNEDKSLKEILKESPSGYFDHLATSNGLLRITSDTFNQKFDISIAVYNTTCYSNSKTTKLNKDDFYREGLIWSTTGGVELLSNTGSSTQLVTIRKGDKVTASLYNNDEPNSSNIRNIVLKTLSGVNVRSLSMSGNTEGEPNIWTFEADRDYLVGFNSVMAFDKNEVWVEIDRSEQFEESERTIGFEDGRTYHKGEMVEWNRSFYKAKVTTQSMPPSKDWDILTGNSTQEEAKILPVGIPKTVAVLNLEGQLPATTTGNQREIKDNLLTLIVDGNRKFQCRALMSIQGQTSAQHPKKGYSLDLYGLDGKSLKLKFGGSSRSEGNFSWPAGDSYHLKAFWADELLTRDVGGNRFWREIMLSRGIDELFMAPLTIPEDGESKKTFYQYSSRYITDGFPVILNVNGDFHGVYVFRQKKDRSNFRLEKDNKEQIWLEAEGNSSMANFIPSAWQLRNPKLPDYVDKGPITDPDVLADINRFWGWISDVRSGAVNFNETHADYIRLNVFIQYIIFTEVIYNMDGLIKNFHLLTYGDGVWLINPYDLDLTLSYSNMQEPDANIQGRVLSVFSNQLLNYIYDNKLDDIKSEYKRLRDLEIISVKNLFQIYNEIPSKIGEEYLDLNFKKWESMPYQNHNKHRSSVQFIVEYFKNRIDYLDSIWDD